jgi:hypothetical protein
MEELSKFHAMFKQPRSTQIYFWDFFAPNTVEAEEYIRSRDHFRDCKIITLEQVEKFEFE